MHLSIYILFPSAVKAILGTNSCIPDVHKYSYTENEYQGGGTLLNRGNFSTIFPFIYLDLRNQKLGIEDGATKLTFNHKLSGAANADYTTYALVLYERC